MSSDRPLPTVIGPTENALRALLEQTLASTAIANYPAWVVINTASSAAQSGRAEGWMSAVADALKVEVGDIHGILRDLQSAGLLDEHGSLTQDGAAELSAARSAVGATTFRLLEGIDHSQQETTRHVLDSLRHKAESLLNV